jgi:alpha-beta hydrolase superfamily lysophospholipase
MQQFIRASTEDNLLLQGLLHHASEDTDKIVVHIHGMAGNFYENRFIDAMADTFTSNGWAFLCPNTRGHDLIADIPIVGVEERYKRVGNSSEVFQECVFDIKAWLDVAESMGYKNIVLQGHSLGAVKATYYMAKTKDSRVSKLVLASPPDMIGLAEQEKDHMEKVTLATQMIKDGKNDELMPQKIWDWFYLTPHTFLNFSMRDNEIDIFNTYDENKESKNLASISLPILAFCGSEDDANIVPADQAMSIIKKKAKQAQQFDTKVIAGAPHSYFNHEAEVADLIMNWL